MFSLQDNYPLSLGKFFRKRSHRLNHNRLHWFLALRLSILVNCLFLVLSYPFFFFIFGQPFNSVSYPFLDFGKPFNVSCNPYLFLVNRLRA